MGLLKAVSYSPVPLKGAGALTDDDFMSSNTSLLWGSHGRRDLAIMKDLGANGVRLYGNDPALDHRLFFNEAHENHMKVITGISDYPYMQMQGNCRTTNWNCYAQVKEQYAMNLRNGFLLEDGKTYHPALQAVILVNEPDLKFSPPGRIDLKVVCKAIISAF